MAFSIGDKVVHRYHGPGRIARLDQVETRSGPRDCYVVTMGHGLVVWVPIDGSSEVSLRPPLSASTVARLADILRGLPQPLHTASKERTEQIRALMKDGSPEALCTLVRDLTAYGTRRVLNAGDAAALERARSIVIAEWALATDSPDAAGEIDALLRESARRNAEDPTR